jgi:2-furoyl-CoA dehydrogenase FAD binding subunit
VSIPAAAPGTGYAVEEFARRHGDYAICGVAAVARGEKVTLVHFGIGPVPLRTELDDVADLPDALAEIEFASDLHGTAAYRRHLAEVLGKRAIERAVA